MNKHLTFLSALALTTGLSLQAQNVNQMVIQANKIGAEMSFVSFSVLCQQV